MADSTKAQEEPAKIEINDRLDEFELVDARRNVAEREDVPPDGGKSHDTRWWSLMLIVQLTIFRVRLGMYNLRFPHQRAHVGCQ